MLLEGNNFSPYLLKHATQSIIQFSLLKNDSFYAEKIRVFSKKKLHEFAGKKNRAQQSIEKRVDSTDLKDTSAAYWRQVTGDLNNFFPS